MDAKFIASFLEHYGIKPEEVRRLILLLKAGMFRIEPA
jgi:hypothetical protein